MTASGIEAATCRFIAQCLNHYTTARPYLRDNVENMVEPDRPQMTVILTYLLTPWGRVLLEKLTGSAASQEIPRIFGTRRFITIIASARHQSLS